MTVQTFKLLKQLLQTVQENLAILWMDNFTMTKQPTIFHVRRNWRQLDSYLIAY